MLFLVPILVPTISVYRNGRWITFTRSVKITGIPTVKVYKDDCDIRRNYFVDGVFHVNITHTNLVYPATKEHTTFPFVIIDDPVMHNGRIVGYTKVISDGGTDITNMVFGEED